jgi:putative ABC transport system permease protein
LQSIRLALIGLAIGTALALGVSRIYVFVDRSGTVDSFDSIAYAAAIISVFLTCMMAGFFPSLRAARIDPVTALRYD